MGCGWNELNEQMTDWLLFPGYRERGKVVVQFRLILIDRLLVQHQQQVHLDMVARPHQHFVH